MTLSQSYTSRQSLIFFLSWKGAWVCGGLKVEAVSHDSLFLRSCRRWTSLTAWFRWSQASFRCWGVRKMRYSPMGAYWWPWWVRAREACLLATWTTWLSCFWTKSSIKCWVSSDLFMSQIFFFFSKAHVLSRIALITKLWNSVSAVSADAQKVIRDINEKHLVKNTGQVNSSI